VKAAIDEYFAVIAFMDEHFALATCMSKDFPIAKHFSALSFIKRRALATLMNKNVPWSY
jgi:hypothetical protein